MKPLFTAYQMPPRKARIFTDFELEGLSRINWQGYFDIWHRGTHGIVLPNNPEINSIQDTLYLISPFIKYLISGIRCRDWADYNIPRSYTFMRLELPIPKVELCDLIFRGEIADFKDGLALRNVKFQRPDSLYAMAA